MDRRTSHPRNLCRQHWQGQVPQPPLIRSPLTPHKPSNSLRAVSHALLPTAFALPPSVRPRVTLSPFSKTSACAHSSLTRFWTVRPPRSNSPGKMLIPLYSPTRHFVVQGTTWRPCDNRLYGDHAHFPAHLLTPLPSRQLQRIRSRAFWQGHPDWTCQVGVARTDSNMTLTSRVGATPTSLSATIPTCLNSISHLAFRNKSTHIEQTWGAQMKTTHCPTFMYIVSQQDCIHKYVHFIRLCMIKSGANTCGVTTCQRIRYEINELLEKQVHNDLKKLGYMV